MEIKRRTQGERSAATREALVDAARELFTERGFAGVGTETIVRAAGVTRGALYHQFADKVELITYCVKRYKAHCVTRYDEMVSRAESPSSLADQFAAGMTATTPATDGIWGTTTTVRIAG